MKQNKIILVCGFSRSGTTWLASMMDADPNTFYVSEPDKRVYPFLKFGHPPHCCKSESAEFALQYKESVKEIMENPDCNLRSYPFFKKNYARVPHFLYGNISMIYQTLTVLRNIKGPRRMAVPSFLFDHNKKVDLLWKSVNQSSNLEFLTHVFPEMKVIYILRNPYSVMSSILQHQKMALDGDDLRRIDERKFSLFFNLNAIDRERILSFSDIQKRAFLWRIECESAYMASQKNSNIHILLYEDLVSEPSKMIEKACSFVSLPFSREIRTFLSQSRGVQKPPLTGRILSRGYFGVYRQPRVDLNKWKKNLNFDQYSQIQSVIKDSPLMRHWSDLDFRK